MSTDIEMVWKEIQKLRGITRADVKTTLPWDTVILLIASTIVGLSVSDAIAEFLKPESSKVTCFVPTFNDLDRDQYQYVNEFCYNALPYTVNFSIALLIQGLLLIALHYFWRLVLSNRIQLCFTYISQIESIPRYDKNTGKYTEKNIEIASAVFTKTTER